MKITFVNNKRQYEIASAQWIQAKNEMGKRGEYMEQWTAEELKRYECTAQGTVESFNDQRDFFAAI